MTETGTEKPRRTSHGAVADLKLQKALGTRRSGSKEEQNTETQSVQAWSTSEYLPGTGRGLRLADTLL